MNPSLRSAPLILLVCLAAVLAVADVPQLINYQGRVAVGTVNFNGSGQFKFALVNATGTTTYWSNDGSSTAGSEPAAAVSLTVTKGLYSVLLGDATLTNMTAIPNSVFANSDVRLRVWFNDGTNGSQLLTPDQRIAAVGYAMMAGSVPDGAITGAKIASGAVGSTQLANGAVGSAQLGANAVQSSNIATGAVGSSQLASYAAASNLNESGQSGVASGGLILSATENNDLVGAGYVRIGATTLADGWQQRNPPGARYQHDAVWTGSEMIIWGGYGGTNGFLNDGARYNPATNAWAVVSKMGAPRERSGHSMIWTGSEMIVWGGYGWSDGSRYDPVANTWTAVSTTDAPDERGGHTAVWTGTEMIIWGGQGDNGPPNFAPSFLNDGGRYNPTANTWAPMTMTAAPSGRSVHKAVWTGSEMIVWGGSVNSGSPNYTETYFNTGGRYNPTGNSWTAMTTTSAPAGRTAPTVIWTGTEMIVWGGAAFSGPPAYTSTFFNDGGRYNPTGNTWTAVSPTGTPAGRSYHTAVWTGTKMIVWGGYDGTNFLNNGGLYNPTANTWTAVASTSAPVGRSDHTAVWTGSEMIVWGGYGNYSSNNFDSLGDGGRYNPTGDTWSSMTFYGAPPPRLGNTTLWTGNEMIVWGGGRIAEGLVFNDGGRYNPVANTWTAVPTAGAPAARAYHTAVWTGTEMIVWGGFDTFSTHFNDGGRYNPTANTWAPVTTTGAPAGRTYHTAVWTGTEMIVWGGSFFAGPPYFNNGGRYNPAGNTWTAVATTSAPSMRHRHTAVIAGSWMIIWGGYNGTSSLNDGGRYDHTANTWSPVNTVGAPTARAGHTAVVATEFGDMLIWGGGNNLNDGGRYIASGDFWVPLTTTGAPAGRTGHTVVWIGYPTFDMVVWGGAGQYGQHFNDGARFNLGTNNWTALPAINPPAARQNHSAVWTGSEMIIWGGYSDYGYTYYHSNEIWSYSLGRSMVLYQRP